MITNKNMKKTLSLLIAILMIIGPVASGVNGESHQVRLAEHDLKEEALNKIEKVLREDLRDGEMTEVLVYMGNQVDTQNISYTTRGRLSSLTANDIKLEVRKEVVEALKDEAEITQGNLLRYLEAEEKRGNVEKYNPYHIVNMVYVKGTKEVIEQISYMSEVEKIYKNKSHTMEYPEIKKVDSSPTSLDPKWNITRIGADLVWNLGFDGTGIVVGIIDSGVDWTHPALKNQWLGYDPDTGAVNPTKSWFDPIYNANLPEDSESHGTHVLGSMVGIEPDGSNPIGVAPGAKWIGARVFDKQGATTDEVLLAAAQWMLAPGGDVSAAPDVINNSWGGGDGLDDWYLGAVQAWRAAGIFPVFAAGNQRRGEPAPWPGSISIPSNYIESFAVAAVDKYDIRGAFSKLGPSPYDPKAIKPDISAPGVDVYSSIPGGYTGDFSGTSMAAPHVAGTVALILSANASLTVEEIEELLISTTDQLTDDSYPISPNMAYGYGMINAFEAVSQEAEGTGFLSGSILKEGQDMGELIINHQQKIFEAYEGSRIDIETQISDDISVVSADLLIKQEDKSYWIEVPMSIISGDYKDGIYSGRISPEMIIGDSLIYKIVGKDYSGKKVSTEDFKIDIKFGIQPGKYVEDFEKSPVGWTFNDAWEWGEPSGRDPEAYDGKKLVGTSLGGLYPLESNHWMVSPPIDLRDESLISATLRFNEWYEIEEEYDNGRILITSDNGENWMSISHVRTGDCLDWKESVINLGNYIGTENPIFIAFLLESDEIQNRRGWYIDNVSLVGYEDEVPATPRGLAADPTLSGIRLNWEPVEDADLSHYEVYRSLVSSEGFEAIGNSKNSSYTDNTAEPGTKYYYKVVAVDYVGNMSDFSNVISAYVVRSTVLFSTDFEDDNGGFITGITSGNANPWQWGMPLSGPYKANSGRRLWATNLGGNYDNRTNAYIESPSVYIPEDLEGLLTFSHWVDMEGDVVLYDYGQVLISKDDGDTWTNITPTVNRQYGKRIRSWSDEEIFLSDYRGENIKIRFHFYSDESGVHTGWYIDDISIVGLNTEDIEMDLASSETLIEENRLIKEFNGPIINDIDKENINYNIISNEEVSSIPLGRKNGIPIEDGIVTILDTGRSIKVDPRTGKYRIQTQLGDYRLRAQAYGYHPQEKDVVVVEGETTKTIFLLEPKSKATIRGRVYDRYYDNPVAHAKIRLVEDGKIPTTIADENGEFLIEDVYEGQYTLKVSANGYFSDVILVDLVGNETEDVDVALERLVGKDNEIIYDDGIADNAIVSSDDYGGVAVRFTPEGYGTVKGANIYFWDKSWPNPGGDFIGFTIYGLNENGTPYKVGEPIYQKIERGAWNFIDLSGFDFATDRDFLISTIQDGKGENNPGTGVDKTSQYGYRSYINNNGKFEPLSNKGVTGGLMIRAILETPILAPHISNLQEINYTKEDSLIIKGRTNSDSKINIYINDKRVKDIVSEDKVFETEVELTEEINILKLTAELDGRETEPSQAIKVIRDKEAPLLIVESPGDNTTSNKEVIHIIGRATDKIGLDKLLINGKEISVEEDGSFDHRVMVERGKMKFVIEAIDLAGNKSIKERNIEIDPIKPIIKNMTPATDLNLLEGEEIMVSFDSKPGGEAYFRFATQVNGLSDTGHKGIAMVEREEGHYEGRIILPAGFAIENGYIRFELIDQAGNRVVDIAPGRITVTSFGMGNIKPGTNKRVVAGEEVEISFKYLEGGESSYELIDEDGSIISTPDSKMKEIEPGIYKSVWIVPMGLAGHELRVRLKFEKPGNETINVMAPGRIEIVENMDDLPVNTVIIGDQGFDARYLESNTEAMNKLKAWDGEIYIKLNEQTLVNAVGEIVDNSVLNDSIVYYDINGNIRIYQK